MSLTWSSFNAGGRVPHFFSACAFGKAGFVIPGRRAGFLLVLVIKILNLDREKRVITSKNAKAIFDMQMV